jgi:hypothetical protein
MAYASKGEGVVVMTNGGDGRRLIDQVVRALATDYGWTDIARPSAPEQRLATADLANLAGRYEGGGLSVLLEARPDGLYAQLGGPGPERLPATSPTRFRADSLGVTIEFSPDRSSFDMVEGGPPLKFVRTAVGP